jgi:hypothetical protein
MRCQIGSQHPLRQLFTGMVEQVFQTEVGICDVRVTDYLSQMLTEFVHIDDVFRLRRVDGGAIRDLSEMHAAAQLGPETTEVERRRVISRFVGDFTLFWAGVYPEQLRPRGGVDRLHEYLLQGKRSYGIASELSQASANPPGDLLRQLSEEFEFCVHGLHLVRAGWEALAGGDHAN